MVSLLKVQNKTKAIGCHFEKAEKKKIWFAIVGNSVLSLLDIMGVALIGLIAAISVRGIQSDAPGARVSQVLVYLNIENQSLQYTVSILGVFAALSFLLRTALSAYITRKLLVFLGKKSADISASVTKGVLGKNIQSAEGLSSTEILYSITSGATSLTIGVVGSAVTLISDVILVLVLLSLLVFFNPAVAVPTAVVFLLTSVILNGAMHKKASHLGVERFEVITFSNNQILDALSIQRNIHASNLQADFLERIHKARRLVGKNLAESEFMPYITKYTIELVLVIFVFSLAAIQFIFQDAAQAVATLSIFMAAGMRIAPAVMRMQQASIQLVGSLANAESTLSILEKFEADQFNTLIESDEVNNSSVLECRNIGFKFSPDSNFEIKNLSLRFEPGTLTAIVGPSGSGKSTLIDLLLGINKPSDGSISLMGRPPSEAIQLDPELVGYVPQNTHIISGSILENVFLRASEESELGKFWEVLRLVGLDSFVKSLPGSEKTLLGEGGLKISGGQAQRLGIARALVKRPALVILDEATSALDAQAENLISESLTNFKANGACVIVIAHRLSTVRRADCVIYLENGSVIASAEFEELRKLVPDFDNQAKIMGL
jgi:ABC-type multidrug transport system fused ATPase/permease subunit